MQDGIGAALTIDANIMTDLEAAQARLQAMSAAADVLTKNFKAARTEAANLAKEIDGIKIPKIKIEFKEGDILEKISKIADAAARLNSTGVGQAAASKSVSLAEQEAMANDIVEKAMAKKANTYASITQRIREYEKALDQLNAVSRLNATASAEMRVDQEHLNQSIARAQTLITDMRERISGLGVGFSASSSETAIMRALGLDDSTYDEAIVKLKALDEAKKEVLKPGTANITDVSTQTEWATRLQESIDSLKGKLPQLREEMERAKLAARDSQGKSRLDEALGLDEASVDKMKSKIKQIEDAMRSLRGMKGGDTLSRGAWLSSAGKEIDRLRSKMALLNKAMGRTSEAASYMQNMITDAFSVYAIGRFLQEMVQIRAQFQMTEKSLAVIINDANLAKEMFSDIQEMAVQSPFQVSELASYTKQLAAYRIETDKLLPSMRMLSDISAGVGVDMNRLILAFGQVRAAQFLRLTEVRQFTEAGVDVLGGLADRFTELYQRSVSVGEVMDMITKKMVTFGDLEAVLQSMTGAGGMFYKMQEQQAETLQGAISNLRDRFEIALNNMGSNYDGFIQGLINGIGSILEHYQTLEVAIAGGLVFKTLSGGLALVAKGLVNMEHNTIRAIKHWRKLIEGMGGLKSVGMVLAGFGPYLAALAAAAVAIGVAWRNATKEARELKKIQQEGASEMNELVANYRRLTTEVKNAANGTQAQKRALEQLQQAFSNILPAQDMQIENIGRLNQSYDEHIRMIRRYVDEKTREKQVLEILENLNEKLNNKDYGSTDYLVNTANRILLSNGSDLKATEADIMSAAQEVADMMLDGTIKSTDAAIEKMGELLDIFYSAGGTFSTMWARIYNETKDISGGPFNSLINILDHIIEKTQKIADINKSAFTDINIPISVQGFYKELDNLKDKVSEIREELLDKNGTDYYEDNNALLTRDIQERLSDYKKNLIDKIGKSGIAGAALRKLYEDTEKEFAKFTLSPIEDALNDVFADINEKYNLGDKLQLGVGNTAKSENEGLTAYANKIKGIIGQQKDLLENFRTNPTEIISEDFHQVYATAEEAENHIAALNALLAQLPSSATKAAQGTKELDSALKNLSNAVVDFSERMDNLDTEGTDLYMAKLQELARLAQTELPEAFDRASVFDWLNSLQERLGKDAVLDFKIRFNATNVQESIEEVANRVEAAMDKYQKSKTFENMGFSIAGFSTSEQIAELQRLEGEYRNIGTKDALEAAEELKQRRLEIFRSEQEEAMKIMAESQQKQSSETIRIIEDTQQKLKSIGNVNANAPETGVSIDSTVIDESKAAAVNNMLQQIAKSQWDAFKNTQMEISAFGDLEGLSLNVLEKLKTELEGFAASSQNLEPSEAKTLMETLDKINLKIKQGSGEYGNFFNLVMNGLRDVRDAYRAIPEAEEDVDEAFAALTEQVGNLTAGRIMERLKEGMSLGELTTEFGVSEQMLEALNRAMQTYVSRVNNAKNTNAALTQNLRSLESAYGDVGSYMDDIIGLAGDIAEAFGFAFSDDTNEAIDAFRKGFGMVGTAISGVIGIVASFQLILKTTDITAKQLMATLTPLLAVGLAIGAAMAAFTAADNRKVKEVERHKKAVEQLQETYGKLEESMENALTAIDMKESYENAQRNLHQQAEELRNAIEAEKSRGAKADEENISEMESQLKEIQDEGQELRKNFYEGMGIDTDWTSMASDWAKSWLDSFKETGSGLSSLQENFDEFIDNIIAQKLALGIMGPFMQHLQAKIDQIMADNEITAEEIAELNPIKDLLPEYEKMLREAAEALGIGMKDSVETSDLQKDIQNITETTGQALQSLVNSIRFYTADSNARITRMESVIAGVNGVQSPLLTAINNQTVILNEINSTLRSVVRAGHPKGGSAVKVFLD